MSEIKMNPVNLRFDPQLASNPDEQFLMEASERFPDFDVLGAYNEGNSIEEIQRYLEQEFNPASFKLYSNIKNQHPYFDIQSALNEGHSMEDIEKYLEENEEKEEKPFAEKAGRIGAQYALGILQGSPAGLVYDISTSPLSSELAQNVTYRENLGDDLERLMEQKAMGQWDEQDQALYDSIVEQIKDPRKSLENVQTADIGIRDIAEKVSGVDLKPEGILEKAANWAGIIKNPQSLADLAKSGLSKRDLVKSISPSGSEFLRGLGAGTALEIAEEGEYGPMGTLGAAIVGDLVSHGVSRTSKKALSLLKKPKETLSKDAAKVFTFKDKSDLQKEIINDFRKQGIQADLGTITGNDLVKMMEARLSQSGLAGRELREFKDQMINQVKEKYEELANSLGESRFATQYEAGETLKNVMKSIRDKDLEEARNYYKEAERLIKKDAYVDSRKLYNTINEIEKNLKPGAVKSSEQRSVLDTIERLKRDISDSEGRPIYASVKDLINNKIALNDIINYEVQGGTKQLLKRLVNDLDRSIISYGKENPSFAKNYIQANKKFSDHAKTFRSKNNNAILLAADPEKALSKMNSVYGIREIEKALSKSTEGKKLFQDLKRNKMDEIIWKKLVDSTTSQAKLGSFSKLLDKGKNRELIKEILGPKDFKRLELLQKNAGRLAKSVEQFYNASKSGVTALDAALTYQAITSLFHLLYGNPWPFLKISGGLLGAKKLGKLLADPEFLKLTEEAILSYEKNNPEKMKIYLDKIKPIISKYLEIE